MLSLSSSTLLSSLLGIDNRMVVIHDLDTDQPYLLLRDPFVRYRLTLLSKDDLPAMTSILSDTTIAQYLLNVPEPYTEQDALSWYNMQPTNHDLHYLSTKSEQKQKCVLSGRFPFSVIRDMESNGGELVGYFSIRRNNWEWMAAIDPAGRANLRKDNEAKEAGDKSISYSIGEQSPGHHVERYTSN